MGGNRKCLCVFLLPQKQTILELKLESATENKIEIGLVVNNWGSVKLLETQLCHLHSTFTSPLSCFALSLLLLLLFFFIPRF